MKIIKRLLIGLVVYLVWKEVGFPILIVGASFFGPLFFDKHSEAGKDFAASRQQLVEELGAWLNKIDPNTIVYAAAFLLGVIFLALAIRTKRRNSFSLSRKQEGGQTLQAGGLLIGQKPSEEIGGRVS
jgi:preprotein translocase subunit SecG